MRTLSLIAALSLLTLGLAPTTLADEPCQVTESPPTFAREGVALFLEGDGEGAYVYTDDNGVPGIQRADAFRQDETCGAPADSGHGVAVLDAPEPGDVQVPPNIPPGCHGQGPTLMVCTNGCLILAGQLICNSIL